jgi:hypothetical protein
MSDQIDLFHGEVRKTEGFSARDQSNGLAALSHSLLSYLLVIAVDHALIPVSLVWLAFALLFALSAILAQVENSKSLFSPSL